MLHYPQETPADLIWYSMDICPTFEKLISVGEPGIKKNTLYRLKCGASLLRDPWHENHWSPVHWRGSNLLCTLYRVNRNLHRVVALCWCFTSNRHRTYRQNKHRVTWTCSMRKSGKEAKALLPGTHARFLNQVALLCSYFVAINSKRHISNITQKMWRFSSGEQGCLLCIHTASTQEAFNFSQLIHVSLFVSAKELTASEVFRKSEKSSAIVHYAAYLHHLL